MMEQRRTLIVTGLILLLLIGLVGAVIYFLVGFIRPKSSAVTLFPKSSSNLTIATNTPNPSATTYFPTASSTPVATSVPATGNTTKGGVTLGQSTKLYQGQGFQVFYPQNWGLLTCNNSQNFEFDPTSSTDQKGYPCDRAVKPITVLVGQSSCTGGTVVNLGGTNVRKIVTDNINTPNGGHGKQYHWCTTSGVSLDITHRVGTGVAFSSQDYSAQVEQMIVSLRQGSGGS